MRDETFDYGLAPGESFEPIDDAGDWFDLTQPHLQTALGPIDPDDLGYTACLGLSGEWDDHWSRDPAGTVAALEDAYNAGLRGLLIAESPRDEQEVADLMWIAGRSPIHLIVAKNPIERDVFVDTTLKPGCLSVSKARFESRLQDAISDGPERLPLVVAGLSDQGMVVLSSSNTNDLDVDRLVEAVLKPDFDVITIELGLFNAVRIVVDHPLQNNMKLVQPDYADLLLLAIGPSPSSWAEAVERSPLELMERGFDAPTVRRILVDNPARALTIRQ